jgi:hypothetical protein
MSLRLFSDEELFGASPNPRGGQPMDSAGNPLPSTGVQTPAEEESPGFFGTVADMAYSAPGGAVKAGQEMLNFGRDVINWFDDALGIDAISNDEEDRFDFSDYIYTPKTAMGGLTQSATQFLAGFVGAGKILAPIKALKAGTVTASLVKGAVSDITAFDPHMARFSNLLDRFPSLRNPVTDYLRADDKDGVFEGRFKNALEGLVLGGITEAIFTFTKGLKAVKAGKKSVADLQTEVAKVLEVRPPAEELTQAKARQLELFSLDPANKSIIDGYTVHPSNPEDVFKATEKALKDGADILNYDSSKHINPVNLEDGADIIRFTQAAAEPIMKAVDKLDGGILSFVEASEMAIKEGAALVGSDPEFVLRQMRVWAEQGSKMPIHLMTIHKAAKNSASRLVDMMHTYSANPNDILKAKILNEVETYIQLTIEAKRMSKAAGRAVVYHRTFTSGMLKTESSSLIEKALAQFGPQDNITALLNKLKMADNPLQAGKLISASLDVTKGRAVINAANEYWINCILSNPVTQIVNMGTTALETLVLPAEKLIGGLKAGDHELAREGVDTFIGFAHVFSDAWQMARKAFKLDDNILKSSVTESIIDPRGGPIRDKAISAMAFGKAPDTILGRGLNMLGKIMNLPNRFLMAEDEFFSQLMYRGTMFAKLKARGIQQGITDGKALKEFIYTEMDKAFSKRTLADGTEIQGRGIAKDILEEAKRVTFTSDLERGIGKTLQNVTVQHPYLKPLMPFVRTPTNIFRNVWQRTPILNKLQFQHARMLRGGDPAYLAELAKQGGEAAVKEAKRQFAIAQGREAIGGLVWGTAMVAAMTGTITGSGPADHRARAILQETGWQPYSLKVGDTYIQYSRLDPYGMFFGLAADMCVILQNSDGVEGAEIAGLGLSMMVKNLSSKTYLRGLVEAMNAITGDDDARNNWIERTMASALPFSALSGQIRNALDPEYKEMQGILDTMKNKIPGLSSTLPAKYSWLTGEVQTMPDNAFILPTPWRKDKDDLVLSEMARLDYGFAAPPKKLDGVELTTEQISEFNRLHGQIKIGGKTLKDRLKQVMESNAYDINRERYPDSPDGLSSKRLNLVLDTVTRYRTAAKRELLKQNPDLAGQIAQMRLNARLARSGSAERIAQIVK